MMTCKCAFSKLVCYEPKNVNLVQRTTRNMVKLRPLKAAGFIPELGLLRCDDAHFQLRGLEVDGENGGQTRDGRLFMGDRGHKG